MEIIKSIRKEVGIKERVGKMYLWEVGLGIDSWPWSKEILRSEDNCQGTNWNTEGRGVESKLQRERKVSKQSEKREENGKEHDRQE